MATTAPRQSDLAAENERLRAALGEALQDRDTALERQRALVETLEALNAAPAALETQLTRLVAAACGLAGAPRGTVALVEGDVLRIRAGLFDGEASDVVRAAAQGEPTVREAIVRGTPLTAGTVGGRAVRERRTVYVEDIESEDADGFPWSRQNARETGWRSVVAVPLLRGGEALGSINVFSSEPGAFDGEHLRLLDGFAQQAAIAVATARLVDELGERNRALREALDQQTAIGDVLGVIAASPSDVQRVLDAIAERATRLCAADDALINLVVDGMVLSAAHHGPLPFGGPATGGAVPLARMMEDPRYVALQAYLRGSTVHVPDLEEADDAEFGITKEGARRLGYRTQLSVPLIVQGRTAGTISLRRREAMAFTGSQIRLVESFAAQAAVAIENSRLFSELRERDERRRQELERAAAIQARLLPSSTEGWPGVLEIAHRFRPAVETSGDFFDVLALPGAERGSLEPLQIAVGDVAGKGMAAALVTALARSALRASVGVPIGMASPAGTLRTAGQRLHRDVGSGHFVACALGVVEPPGLHHRGPLLRLANAAQVPVLLVRSDAAREIEPPGYRLPLGAQADASYRDAEVELRPGDVVVFSSDGLVEAPSAGRGGLPAHLQAPAKPGELFGFARLAASAVHWASRAGSADEVAAGVWSDLSAWCGDESHHDDMTLLALRVPT